MTSNFLLQATKVLHDNNFDDNELDLITNFLLAADEDILYDYNNSCTFFTYDCDLDLFIEIIKTLITIYEEREEYEICEMLKFKIDDAIIIKNNKTI